MYKENRGFTLLELIISIAVLSIMAGVLFQAFVVSRRIDTKAAREERVQNLAKSVMEDMKGASFWELEKKAEGEEDGTVTIGSYTYTCEPLAGSGEEAGGTDYDGGYLLKREHRISGSPEDRADYLIEVEADANRYKSAAEGDFESSYSINRYRMPNIADVSSFQNIVISPDMMIRDDAIRVSELLEKVNPEEETGADGEPAEAAAEPEYNENDVEKALRVDIAEATASGDEDAKLLAGAYGIYTVAGIPESMEAVDAALSVTFPVASFKKHVMLDEKTGKSLNRIYLFLPPESAVEYEKIYINSDIDSDKEHFYELYVIVNADNTTGKTEESYITLKETTPSVLSLLTNLETNKPVSLYDAGNHLYRLQVTIYEADYAAAEGSAEPAKGKALLTLDSTKSE